VCEWGAIERVQSLGKGRIIGLDTTARTGAIMVRKESKIETLTDLRQRADRGHWHAGTFYAAIEVLEAAGTPSTRSSSCTPMTAWTRCCRERPRPRLMEPW